MGACSKPEHGALSLSSGSHAGFFSARQGYIQVRAVTQSHISTLDFKLVIMAGCKHLKTNIRVIGSESFPITICTLLQLQT